MKKQEYNIGYLLALLAILIPGLLGTVYESVFNFYNLNAYYDGQLPNLLSVLAMFSLAIALFITGRLFKGWTTSSDIVRKMYVFIAVLNLLFVISTSFESMVARYVDFSSPYYWHEIVLGIGAPTILAVYLYFTKIKLVKKISIVSFVIGITSLSVLFVAFLFR
ncbi:hypothetical protein KA529_03655 [Candidatus Saccharibacteria bacterium]|nr:hypothetical protein [Candidatus Saccharibacteria bacterium]